MTNTYLQQNHIENSELYQQDYCLWIQTTIEQLRAKSFDKVDWEILLEELDSLVRSDKRELQSRLIVLLVHLLKYQYQKEKRSRSWVGTIWEQFYQIEFLLKDSPSLKPYYLEIFGDIYTKAVRAASSETKLPIKSFPTDSPFLPVDVLNYDFIYSLIQETD